MDTSKIIKGVVNSGRYTVTAPIVKEDYGLYLQIEGVELPSTYEVDFSNSEHNGTSVTMIGNSDGVLIPSQFISSGKDVFAFLYHVGADFGRTVYKFRIPNKVRPDRTDEEPTPEEQSTIDQAISALNTAVEQTAQDVIDASASAQNASADAERAEEARTDAQNYANSAETSANNASASASQASASATASGQSASQAEQIKADVESLADDAQASADASYQNAQTAQRYAQDSATYARQAESYANGASGYASQAQTSAQTASAKAQDASQSASTASAKATEASQSATNASQSAQTAEQAKTASQTAQGLAESARDSAQGYAEDAQGYANDAQASAESISASASQIAQNTADILKAFPTDSASGSIASFPDGADNIPLKSLVVDIDPVQDLSNGDPSPENICPISGWEGCEVNATGINILDVAQFVPLSRTTIDEVDGNTGKIAFTATTSYYGVRIRIPIRKFAGKKVAFSALWPTSPKRAEIRIFDANENLVLNFNESNDGAFTIPANAVTFQMTLSNSTTVNTQIVYEHLQLEVANDVSAFEPFGTTLPISWQSEAGTVYGGKLDVLSGVMIPQIELITLDGTVNRITGTFGNTNDGNACLFSQNIGARTQYMGGSISNMFKFVKVSYPSMPLYSFYGGSGSANTISFVFPPNTTVADANAWLAEQLANGTPVVVTRHIATPIEIQLTPHEVNSLLGANNIFADTGDSAVEYRADTRLYIEKLTQPEEDDMIADSAITSGQFFMVGNTLYRALTNIASGATITVGTNAQRVSLSDALNLVNA